MSRFTPQFALGVVAAIALAVAGCGDGSEAESAPVISIGDKSITGTANVWLNAMPSVEPGGCVTVNVSGRLSAQPAPMPEGAIVSRITLNDASGLPVWSAEVAAADVTQEPDGTLRADARGCAPTNVQADQTVSVAVRVEHSSGGGTVLTAPTRVFITL